MMVSDVAQFDGEVHHHHRWNLHLAHATLARKDTSVRLELILDWGESDLAAENRLVCGVYDLYTRKRKLKS